jgi:hypothetical protein
LADPTLYCSIYIPFSNRQQAILAVIIITPKYSKPFAC